MTQPQPLFADNLAPFRPHTESPSHLTLSSDRPVVREKAKEKAVEKYQQAKLWKLALVVLLGFLLLYVFYRLYKDSTKTAINYSVRADDLVRQGINLKNFVDLV